MTPTQATLTCNEKSGWTLVKMEKSKGNWDFDAASSPQSNDALERLCIRATKERDASASSAASGGAAGQDVGASQRPAKFPSTSGRLGRDGGGGEAR